MKGQHIGELEELVLLAVCGLGEDAYGVPVQQRIEDAAGRSVTIGAVYSALDRLERKGHVHSRVGGACADRGGRRKRYFRLTDSGHSALQEVRRIRDAMWRMTEPHDA